jgi:cytidyltransferase-like protein
MASTSPTVFVQGVFDDVRSRDVRFLEAAARFGPLSVGLFDDALAERLFGGPPKFPAAERAYFLRALRAVAEVRMVESETPASDRLLPDLPETVKTWVVRAAELNPARAQHAAARELELCAIPELELDGFPPAPAHLFSPASGRKKVVVTGCYDWFHSGHVRFFEEVSALGDLYVVVGHDANIRFLKGEGHPLLPEVERRFMVGAVRFVHQALISSGTGWLDAEPEIARLRPDIYAVNEDGDKGGKREFCERQGIEYRVLKRTPAPGLPARSSTVLRGF